MMDFTPLDNPIWHSLNGPHRSLALRSEIAVRYQPDLFFTAALPESNASGFDDLKNLVPVGKVISLFGTPLTDNLGGWESLRVFDIPQMVCDDLKPCAPVEAIQLTIDDVPEMRDLVALTEPGPFLSRTIEMGRYLGLRIGGRLVAMAGQRLHPTGFCEISAVCTHPDYRGRGYAGSLTTMQAESILAHQETPFLHLAPDNHVAKRLYKSLGFRQRAEIRVSVLRRVA
jgi:ribosomal protein S18 acetylase RimI-like enzyme